MLVVNNTKVFPARLTGKKETGGKAEVFLLNYPTPLPPDITDPGTRQFSCYALIKSSRSPQPGSNINISDVCRCILLENQGRGKWLVTLVISSKVGLEQVFRDCGDIPLPPYINRSEGTTPEDANRYQTVYANQPGAVAAPTAGLHFTDNLLHRLRSDGIEICSITLHVGYGTFSPVQVENIKDHVIHHEYIDVSQQTAALINETKKRGGRIWAIGTTTVRALEYAVRDDGLVWPQAGWCDLYIRPGFSFRVVDNLITNFHLPQSSLMFLVASTNGDSSSGKENESKAKPAAPACQTSGCSGCPAAAGGK